MSDKKAAVMKTMSNAVASVSSAAKQALVSKPELMVSSPSSGSRKKLVVVLSLIITVIVGFFAAVFIYRYIQDKTVERNSYIVPETKTPVIGTVVTKGNGSGIPESRNGKRFSFTFWMYVHNLSKNSGQVRHVLHRGDANNFMTGSPSVVMDPDSNKLHIFFDTTDTEANDYKPNDFNSQNTITQIKWLTAKRGITIDYLPLQRWVHIAVVVNETANGGSISSYIDGELVKTVTTNQTFTVQKSSPSTQTYTVQPDLTKLALDRKGDVYIGGGTDSAAGMAFAGLVSLVEFFNYDLNSKDIYKIYSNGPMYLTTADKMANAIGIGSLTNQYGVRNPIYKKPEVSATN